MHKRPVIHVGVDGSWRDTGALEWALQESLFRRVPLRAVHVIEEKLRHSPYWQPTVIDAAAVDLVEEVRQKLVDDSGESEDAIEFALTLATERRAPVQLVHVWDLPAIYSWDAMNVAGVSDEWNHTAEQHFEAVADQWRRKYPDVRIEVVVRRGHAVDGIVTAAESTDAQLLVVGGRRRHHLSPALLGSVARGVVQHATSPVAIVPPAKGRFLTSWRRRTRRCR